MAMIINAKVVGYGPDPETTKALVNIIVEFSGPTETMTLTVIVPNEGDEAALEEQDIARTSLCNSLPTGPRRRNAGRDLSSLRGAHEARQATALARPQAARGSAVSVHRLRECRYGRVARVRR
jgi:hypothetical protein